MSEIGPLSEPEQAPLATPAHDPYGVLRHRDFAFYLVARFIASFAQQAMAVTVGWEIYERTKSKLDLGFVGLVQMAPMFLCVFPAGHVADNYNRKKVIFWAQILLGLACAGLTWVSYSQSGVAWMYFYLFAMGVARTFLWPASSSF